MKVPMFVIGALFLVTAPLVVSAQRATAPPRSVAATAAKATALPASATLTCQVRLIKEVEIAAEESGVLKGLLVQEGDLVKAGDVLAQIDDTLTRQQLKIAENELKVAKKQAENTVRVRYAKAAAAVAWADWQAAEQANRRIPGTFPLMEVKRLELTFDQAKLQIEQEQMNSEIAGLEANVAQAKFEAAEEVIQRRKIKAPGEAAAGNSLPTASGGTAASSAPPAEWVVEELYCHEGEWVQPPQTSQEHVMRLIRADRLWVEGFIKARDFNRVEIIGRPVTVKAELDRGRVVTLEGGIVFTGSEILHGGEYKVRAEVENRKVGGHWLLQPGLRAEMTIHLDQPQIAKQE